MPTSRRIVPKGPDNPLVAVLAYDGLCTFEFGCALEVFALERPEMGPRWYRCTVAAAEPGPLHAAGGLAVTPEGGLDLLREAGTVVVPGWRGVDAAVPAPLAEALRQAHAGGARILSLCSGAFVLAAAGLLDGRRATTHWRYHAALAARFPGLRLVPDVLYVDEGSVLTAAGSAAGLDLMLHLVRRDFGPAAANAVAERLVVPAHRAGAQAQRLPRPVPPERGAAARLSATLDEVRRRLDEAWPIARLARAAATSPRSLNRRFRDATGMSPGEWLIAERLRRAQDLLDAGGATLEDLAAACGFGSAAALRLHFRARLGTTPGAWRDRRAASGRGARRAPLLSAAGPAG
jgi:AraC family transcriptional activator FtrA